MEGRLVQVRRKAGLVGSDKVLIRHLDGVLTCHENQCFIRITNDKDVKKVRDAFKNVCEDVDDEEYKCDLGIPATGFIVENLPKSEGMLSFTVTTITNPIEEGVKDEC